ncbi:MAG TPA: hypothetical protein VFP87_09360 [Chitinophagaceae bacterium]|nr:hypothetical protein [Chitinophagaceae bacterium]
MMKKVCYISLVFVAAGLFSCKKETPGVQITVTDKVSNSPVSNATVHVYKCGIFDCAIGAIDLFIGTTDNSGVCKVPASAYNDAAYVAASKQNYWTLDNNRSTAKYLMPAGWMRLHILRTGNYPFGSTLNVQISSQSTLVFVNSFDAPADSSLLIKLYGGSSNQIDWWVGNATELNRGEWQQQVPRLDTVNVTLNY